MASKGRQKLSLQSLSRLPVNMETYFKELRGESDRACALIAGAAISDELRDLLRRYFIKLNEPDIRRLFYDERAPLCDFGSQIGSFALGLISPQERLVANVIRKIRNLFAHTLAQIDFSQELIVSELSKISPSKPVPDTKAVFIDIFMDLYLALIERSTYLVKQRSGLAGARPPIYELSEEKHGSGIVARD